MSSLANKKILLGVTGSIAAYKVAELIRLLRSEQAEVKVVMTKDAAEFVTELTLQALSGQPVYKELLDPYAEASMSHIALAKWADLLLIAPATANIMAKMTAGIADDLLSTLYLVCSSPVVFVPAMNQHMWLHSATRHNSEMLLARGHRIWGPDYGVQACGDVGPGRMLEPPQICSLVASLFAPKILSGKKVVITAGPTREPIDPARFISNYSSGKMGYALAAVAVELGAETILISGPTQLPIPLNVHIINVETAHEMHAAVLNNITDCDIFIGAAAVADFRCSPSPHKLKKNDVSSFTLEKNPDILMELCSIKKPPFLVGFAAESENVIENAREKLTRKGLDMIVANQIGGERSAFNGDYNQVTVLSSHDRIDLPYASKAEIAQQLLSIVVGFYEQKKMQKLSLTTSAS